MVFLIDNLLTTVVECCYEEMVFLIDCLTFRCAEGKATFLLDTTKKTFPSGIISLVVKAAREKSFDVTIKDIRTNDIPVLPEASRKKELYWLRDYQEDAVNAAINATRGILWLPTGCHGAGTKVLRSTGESVNVEDVVEGDFLIGPDSTARRVLGLCRGEAPIYTVVPSKGHFQPFTVNPDHLLTLIPNDKLDPAEFYDNIIDVKVSEILEDPERYTNYYLCKAPYLMYPSQPMTSVTPLVTKRYVFEVRNNPEFTIPESALTGSLKERVIFLLKMFLPLGVTTVIPSRLYNIRVKSRLVADQIKKLAISCGVIVFFNEPSKRECSLARYYSLSIVAPSPGSRSLKVSAFFLEKKSDKAPFYGFVVDQDHRYLLSDLTITHNSGKTDIITGLMRSVHTNWVMLVHNQKLMYDAAQRYELREHQNWLRKNVDGEDGLPKGAPDVDIKHVKKVLTRLGLQWGEVINRAGFVGDGKREITKHTFCLARSVAVALTSPKESTKYKEVSTMLNNARGLIVDECHVAATETFFNVIMSTPNAYYRVGLSGTPLDRTDKKTHFALAGLGVPKYRILNKTLQDKKVLAIPKITMHTCVQPYTPKKCYYCKGSRAFECKICGGKGYSSKSWLDVRDKLIVSSDVRNKLVVSIIEKCENRPVLIFVDLHKHGQSLKAMLAVKGLTCDFVNGKHQVADRTKFVDSLTEGTADILIASKVFQEGIDIPKLETVVIASGGKSVIAILQKIGRGMRVTATKNTFEVHDIRDVGNKWLENHAKSRIKSYEREGHTVTIK